MEKENVIKEVWPYNLMQRLLGEEDYQKWKTQVPTDFEASLDYFLYATFSERDEGILRKFYQECWQVRDIAEHYSLTAQSIRNIVKHNVRCMASQDNRTYLMMGMTDFLNAQKRIAYAKGYRRGFEHGSKIWSMDLVHQPQKSTDYMLDLPGYDQSITKIRFQSRRLYDMLREAGIYTINQLMETNFGELQKKVAIGKTAIEDINRYLRRIGRKQLTCEDGPRREQPDKSCWPWNLIYATITEDAWDDYIHNLPDEAEQSFLLIFRIGMTDEEQRLLELRFKDKLPYRKIDQIFNEKPDFARRRILICLRRLRHPSRYGIIKEGVKGNILHRLKSECDRGYRDGFNKGVDIREMEYGCHYEL